MSWQQVAAGAVAAYVLVLVLILFAARENPERRMNVIVAGVAVPLAVVLLVAGLAGVWVFLLTRGAH